MGEMNRNNNSRFRNKNRLSRVLSRKPVLNNNNNKMFKNKKKIFSKKIFNWMLNKEIISPESEKPA
jgi:hypothetical protein